MNLSFDKSKAGRYKSPSQITRVLTEDWVARSLFCTACAHNKLDLTPTNTKVIDFICPNCEETYQLKSQKVRIGNKILDAAYEPMIRSIQTGKVPNMLFLHYDPEVYRVENLIVVPRYFLSRSCIEKRKPLSKNARRAGWVGCYIVLKQLPIDGRIPIVQNKVPLSSKEVCKQYNRFKFLAEKKCDLRGWTADVLKVIRDIGRRDFSLEEVYSSEPSLQKLHPVNENIKPKIRQQLQLLRDRGIIIFKGKGKYSLA